ncbi:MAG TPA: ATP-binding protein [Kofleriaceae bacterium]|nr:ATP-binding protein [Kofleriaceae bacterium]
MSDQLSLTIALDTLRHLGMNLYSSLPPVLSELVANAYDARARRADIALADESVTISDDGIGMNRDDIQRKYLVVGRDRRVADPPPPPTADPFVTWPRRDKPMGRKGIGKLAMFSIANEVEIVSVRGESIVALRMKREDIEAAAKANQPYHPEEFVPEKPPQTGTQITLKRLRRSRAISKDAVVRAIARRFSVINSKPPGSPPDSDFDVFVGGDQVTAQHWDVFTAFQALWYLGPESAGYRERCRPDTTFVEVENVVTISDKETAHVTGWLGTVRKPEQLKIRAGETEINDNKIVIDCRGKVAIANFLHQFGESGVYASYLAGYIRADYLDDAEDIATSDRERMREDEPKVIALKAFVWKLLKQIQTSWTEMRRKKALDDTKESPLGPVVKDWLEGLSEDEQDDAKQLLGRLATMRFSAESDRAQVLKYGILAFERLRVRNRIHILRNTPDDQLATVATMFALESDLENALYADIAKHRLDVVKQLEDLVDANAKERIIQGHIFDHLWLLEPSWTIQDQLGARLEARVTTEFGDVSLTREEEEGRLDIRYRRAGGIHIIVELKKPNVSRSVYQLLDQVAKYRVALAKCLLEVENDASPIIQCVCLVGRRPRIGADEERVLVAAGTKILTYDQVISDSGKRFAEYVQAQRHFGRVQTILSKLDEKAAESSET